MLRGLAAAAALLGLPAATVAPAVAQTAPRVRLAAAADCTKNPNCAPGFRRVYRFDPTPAMVRLKVADAGVQALDDGAAEVAVVFSSNPQLSRPDIVALRDDRHMISADHVVPVVRASLLRRYGKPLRARLDAASRLLTTLRLRGLNQQVIDGRLPEAVAGEFIDANALGGEGARARPGPAITVGFQEFAENETLAHYYAAALRGAGFRVRVRDTGGLRPAAVAGMRAGRIDMWPGYSGSLRGYLGGGSLRTALARIGARPLTFAPAEDRNGFAMKADVARSLGVSKLSDLARFFPAAARAAAARVTRVRARVAEDARQGEQWAVSPSSLLDLPGAWQLSEGAGVTVAVVDSGARLDHPDLGPNIWTNFAEVPGNGADDDHNGLVDDVHGIDLTTAAAGQDLTDGGGHGTHVAGIIAAARNRFGVVGVAPKAKIMVVKVLDAQLAGTTAGAAAGIRYAVANGAQIVNLSLRGTEPDPALEQAVSAAAAANVLVVAAAGNDARDIDTQPVYPASIPARNLVSVAATSPDDGRGLADFSNYGQLNVQLAAPGDTILSTANTGGWVEESGTSMAAPMVSGVAALMLSANRRLGAADLRALLVANATRAPLRVAAGYVDALRAVLAASTAADPDGAQAPRVRILRATGKGARTDIQAAVIGSTAAVKRYVVTADGRPAARLAGRSSPFTLTLRRRARRVSVRALDASGRELARAGRAVQALRSGKQGAAGGSRIGT